MFFQSNRRRRHPMSNRKRRRRGHQNFQMLPTLDPTTSPNKSCNYPVTEPLCALLTEDVPLRCCGTRRGRRRYLRNVVS